jgi:multiple sugar transport system permease protein
MELTGKQVKTEVIKNPPGHKRLIPWLFVAPCIVLILLVTIFPSVYSLGLSFFQWEATLKARPFIGLGNYILLFKTERFINSIGITSFLVIVGVFLESVLGFAFANYLQANMRGKRLVVTLMLLPIMVMPVVVGYTWRLLWDAQYGPINQVIGWVIGRPFQYTWLAQTPSAIFAILVTELWQWTPFMFLVFFSGLTTLDLELYDAADIDGASAWNKLWDITIPLMRPIIVVAMLIRGLDALKAFDIIYTLTGGAPGTSTETISFYIYKAGFQFFRLGYGAAASFVLLIALSILFTYLLRMLRSSLNR